LKFSKSKIEKIIIMDVSSFKDKKITVMGLGLHGGGLGTVLFLARHGARLIVTDIKNKEQLAITIEKLNGLKNVEFVLGQHRREDFTRVDMVVKNPMIPWDNQHIKLALERKIPVEMDSSLFFKLCKNPIIGVTGTKGKTTTASMIYDLLKAAGKNPVKVGIGQVSALDKLDVLKKESIVIFELSSWRLSALGRAGFSPHIGVITNLYPDHLNYYSKIENYLRDKKFIFENQKPSDWLVINQDNEYLRPLISETKSQYILVSEREAPEGRAVYLEDNKVMVNDGIDVKELVSADQIKLCGKHNIFNLMLAVGAALAVGIKTSEIKKFLPAVHLVPHRLELVRELNGVKYINDTAATIPQAVISALDSFIEPIILIAGGNDKNLSYSEMGKAIAVRIKKLILLKGTANEKIVIEVKKNLKEEEKNIEIPIVDSMEKAVELAVANSQSGDVVLLSPGAASFGIFLNEFDRGDKFKEKVNKLK
jgi:UDP-N-acetylmuramoylalanine--D-glutamate ligase